MGAQQMKQPGQRLGGGLWCVCLGNGEWCSDERFSVRHLEIRHLALENLEHHHASQFGFYFYGAGGVGRSE